MSGGRYLESGFYAIDDWGPEVGTGVQGARFCTIGGVVKVGDLGQRHLVPNEYVCARLAEAVALPVPSPAIARVSTDVLAFASLRFGPKGETPPPIIPQHLVEDAHATAAGIVLFDCWTANPDRHRENIAYTRGHVPLRIFDHELALFGGTPSKGVERLETMLNSPLVNGCLPPLLTTCKDFQAWGARIQSVHPDIIADLVHMVVCEGGLSPDEASLLIHFLVTRQATILTLIRSAAAKMPKITDW